MAMQVIGAGVGRTGTYSLKLVLDHLGLGPCHHMEEVLHNQLAQVPLWATALNGDPDWEAIYHGYKNAVDWPTAGFFRELNVAFPSAKFVLTGRSPESRTLSFSATIYKLITERDATPPEMQEWLEMAIGVFTKTGFSIGLDMAALKLAFMAHTDAVKATIPSHRLLIYQVKEGWDPHCAFLGVPVPADPFPRSNDRGEFWDRVSGKQ